MIQWNTTGVTLIYVLMHLSGNISYLLLMLLGTRCIKLHIYFVNIILLFCKYNIVTILNLNLSILPSYSTFTLYKPMQGIPVYTLFGSFIKNFWLWIKFLIYFWVFKTNISWYLSEIWWFLKNPGSVIKCDISEHDSPIEGNELLNYFITASKNLWKHFLYFSLKRPLLFWLILCFPNLVTYFKMWHLSKYYLVAHTLHL